MKIVSNKNHFSKLNMETTLTFIDYTSILQLEETGFDILCMNSFLIFKTTHVL